MTELTHERQREKQVEPNGEFLLRRQTELADTALALTIDQAADAPFVEVEDTLARLTSEAEEIIQDGSEPSVELRRNLSRYAHRLLEITDQEPDLLDPRSISLVAHASDATGIRDLLQTTLEQAHRADMTSDTDVNLQAIEAALELDKPFSEVMRTLNESVIPFSQEVDTSHVPLSDEYEYLFAHDASRTINRTAMLFDENGEPIQARRPLYK